MVNEKVGKVTEKERDEILTLHERKLALQELLMTLSKPSMSQEAKDELYNRLVTDMGKTKVAFDAWWENVSQKYQWKSIAGGNWSINFSTCEIFLVENSSCAC